MPKNDGQILESIKFSLEVGKRQNKFEILKGVKKVPMGLSISSKQFGELFQKKSVIKHWNLRGQTVNPGFSEN